MLFMAVMSPRLVMKGLRSKGQAERTETVKVFGYTTNANLDWAAVVQVIDQRCFLLHKAKNATSRMMLENIFDLAFSQNRKIIFNRIVARNQYGQSRAQKC